MQPAQYPMYNNNNPPSYYCDPANNNGVWTWQQQQQQPQQQPVYSSGMYEQYYTSAARPPVSTAESCLVRNELASHVVDGLVELNKTIGMPSTSSSSSSSKSRYIDPERVEKLRSLYTILLQQNVTSISCPDSKSSEQYIKFLNKLGKDQKITRIDKYRACFICV